MSNNNNNEIEITDKDIECIGEKISETLIENGKDGFEDAFEEIISDVLQEKLIKAGYGKDKMKAAIMLLTSDAKGTVLDFDRFNLKDDSKVAAKLATWKVPGKLAELNKYSELVGTIKTLFDNAKKLEPYAIKYNDNGEIVGFTTTGTDVKSMIGTPCDKSTDGRYAYTIQNGDDKFLDIIFIKKKDVAGINIYLEK